MDHRGLDHLPDDVVGEDQTTRRYPSGPPPDRARRRLFWLTTRVFLPALAASLFVLYGIHLGAQYPEAWYTRAVAWLVELLF